MEGEMLGITEYSGGGWESNHKNGHLFGFFSECFLACLGY
jgi:hypothetical protein